MPPSPTARHRLDRSCLEEGMPVFTRQEALAAGITVDEVRWALSSRRWTALRRGHYTSSDRVSALQGDPAGLHRLEASAALKHLRCDAVISHRSAALLHGLPLRRPVVAVTVTTGRQQRRAAVGVDVRTTRGGLDPHVMLDGLPVTSPARTVVDVARCYDRAEALVVADAAVARGLVRREELDELLDSMDRWPGVGAARRALRHVDADCHDPARSWCRGLLLDQGLPRPECDVAVSAQGASLGRYPFVWPARRTMASIDPHDGSPQDQLAELRERRLTDERVRAHGYEVVSFSLDELDAEPSAVADRIRRAFVTEQHVA